MSKQKVDRWRLKNKNKRAENDFNKVMCLYVTHKYGPIAKEVCEFYDKLRAKYPTKKFYKGSRRFKEWVNNQITMYCEGHTSCDDEQQSSSSGDEQQPQTTDPVAAEPMADEQALETTDPVADGPIAGEQVVETTDPIAENNLSSVIQEAWFDVKHKDFCEAWSDSIREQQQIQELDALDDVLDQIIADLEAGQDEGIVADPVVDEVEDFLNTQVDDGEPLVEWW